MNLLWQGLGQSFLFYFLFLFVVWGCFVHNSTVVPIEARRGHWILWDGRGRGIKDTCELPFGLWESNLSLFIRTTSALNMDLSLQPSEKSFLQAVSLLLMDE